MQLSNRLRNMIFSKWTIKCVCLCFTFLILLICAALLLMTSQHEGRSFYLDMFIGQHFAAFLALYPLIEIIIIVYAVYGIFAILTEKKAFVRWYGILMFLAFTLMSLTGGILTTSAVYKVPKTFTKLRGLVEIYEIDLDAETTMDFIQNDLFCCGYNGPADWYNQLSVNKLRNSSDFIAPKSCCSDITCKSYYNSGCHQTINLFLLEILVEVLLVASVLSVLLLLTVLATFRLKTKIEESEEVTILPKILIGTSLEPVVVRSTIGRNSANSINYPYPRVHEYSNFLNQSCALNDPTT